MGKVVTKLVHEPFSLNHAVIISVIVHAVFLSTQPLSFLDKPPILKKQFEEVRIDFIKRTKVIPVIKKVIEERKPSLYKINPPIYPKYIHQALTNPVHKISGQPLSVRPKIVSTVNRPTQIAQPRMPTIQKIHKGKFDSTNSGSHRCRWRKEDTTHDHTYGGPSMRLPRQAAYRSRSLCRIYSHSYVTP